MCGKTDTYPEAEIHTLTVTRQSQNQIQLAAPAKLSAAKPTPPCQGANMAMAAQYDVEAQGLLGQKERGRQASVCDDGRAWLSDPWVRSLSIRSARRFAGARQVLTFYLFGRRVLPLNGGSTSSGR